MRANARALLSRARFRHSEGGGGGGGGVAAVTLILLVCYQYVKICKHINIFKTKHSKKDSKKNAKKNAKAYCIIVGSDAPSSKPSPLLHFTLDTQA